MPRRPSADRIFVVETIAIGSELLVGGRSDSNSLRITEALGRLGLDVRFKSIVGDNEADISNQLRHAVKRAQIVVITGGLGPTVDDCTREAIAAATGMRLSRRKEALEGMTARLAQWGRTPNAGQLRQALIPSGAMVLPNPVGSAPGFCLSWKGATVIALPGVPGEMEAMMTESVIPMLSARLDRHPGTRPEPVTRLIFHTWGLPEAEVDAKLAGLLPPRAAVDLGLLASPTGVLVSLTTMPLPGVTQDGLKTLADGVRARLGE